MRGRSVQALAILLTGLIGACGDSPTAQKAKQEAHEALDAAAAAAKEAGHKIGEGAGKVADKVEAGASVAKEKLESGAEKVGEAARAGAEKVEAGAKDAYARGKEGITGVRDGLLPTIPQEAKAEDGKAEPAKAAEEPAK